MKSIALPKSMGYVHYDLIQEGEDTEKEPQQTQSTVVISRWKFVGCNLIAASLGAIVMFLVMRGFAISQSNESDAPSEITDPAELIAITLPTPSFEYVQEKFDNPDFMTGKILDCGGNPEDARSKGCVFDVMMQDWVPEPCYDSVLTEKYLAQGNWTWYADGEGKTTISDAVMRKGEHGAAWMSTSYHKAHCVFSWLKIIRALRNNRGISQELLSYDHVLHCSHGALKEDSNDEGLGVSAPTNYAKCALYDTWIQDLIPDEHDSTQ